MRCNVAVWDRILRFILGTGLTAYAVAGGPIWGLLGVVLLFTAGWGFCPVYGFLKIRTLRETPRPPRINPFEEQSQEANKPS